MNSNSIKLLENFFKLEFNKLEFYEKNKDKKIDIN